jgi:hypothetical protein
MNSCSISTGISPKSATADHNAAPRGNQVTFVLSGKVAGNCPLIADFEGTWSTSDEASVSLVNNMQPGSITAVCVSATASPATVRNSSSIRGKPFPSATLSCKWPYGNADGTDAKEPLRLYLRTLECNHYQFSEKRCA